MKWVPRMPAKSSGGVTGCSFALMYIVFFMESVATTTLLSALVYLGWDGQKGLGQRGSGSRRDIIRWLDATLQENADGHLSDGLNPSGLITLDLVDADVVLAIAG
jgi:hypothetical protein